MSIDYRPPPDKGLEILYCDHDLLVLNKPSGLLSVPGRGESRRDCLWSRAERGFPGVLVVHRLDMATSGLMLLARCPAAQSAMGRLFQQRQVQKEYLAIVAGELRLSQGEVDLPLITDWPNRPRQKVDHEVGKAALTRYKRIAFDPKTSTSRVLLRPHTGRSHQLRVHMAAIGHPILGDELYAPKNWTDDQPRLLLHASRLAFQQPFTGEPLIIECPPDF